MKSEEISNKTLRDFLTGKLDEATTEKLDELSITNREFADRLAVEQYELVDDWVAGRLDRDEHKAFELTLARSPALREKVKVSKSLAAAALTAVVVERPAKAASWAGLFGGMPRFAYGLAGLVVFIVIVGAIVVIVRREKGPELSGLDPSAIQSPTVAAATVQPAPSRSAVPTANEPLPTPANVQRIKPPPEPTRRASPLFATLALAAPKRGGGNISSLKLASGVEYLLLSLQTEARSSGRFIVEIGDTAGKTDWRSAAVRGRLANGRTIVSVRVPAAKAKSGLVGIRLLDADAASELIDEHVVRIER